MARHIKSKEELDKAFTEAGDKLVVVDFHAVWCGPCKRITPILEAIADKHKDDMVVLKVDVDEVEELVGEYGIQMMPTFVFKRKGAHLDTLVGSNELKLQEHIEKHLK